MLLSAAFPASLLALGQCRRAPTKPAGDGRAEQAHRSLLRRRAPPAAILPGGSCSPRMTSLVAEVIPILPRVLRIAFAGAALGSSR